MTEYLIDTQILIWAIVSPKKTKQAVRAVLEKNTVRVSQISILEIAIKQTIGKLPDFTLSTDALLTQLRDDGFQLLPIANAHIAAYQSIPLIPNHRDPFDRLMLATTLAENLPLISADEHFRAYQPQIRLLDA